MNNQETINSWRWLTPSAPAAIAVVRIYAEEKILQALIRRRLPLMNHAGFSCVHALDGSVVDEAIFSRVHEHALDIACHGGPGMRSRMNKILGDYGLKEDTSFNAFSPRWVALARASSPAAVSWILRHGHEQTPFAAEFLYRLPTILITGPANAGKSTLLNAWCGHERALVSNIPGTTRDLISGLTTTHGWRLQLIDSAGLRAGGDELEQAGQALVHHARQRADVVLYLRPPGDQGGDIGDIIVTGKSDSIAHVASDAVAWSNVGIPGKSPRQLLDALGEVVLKKLGLPVR
jgi:tRNA U34 5-carboxymethylaminomethyl modifying GTPase MnmE/TrmE